MSLTDVVFGRPLASSEESKESLTVLTGVPVLGLDAIASTGYGPEAALLILGQAGLVGLHYYRYIVIAIVAMLTSLYLSYQQTAAAYPSGGGACNVCEGQSRRSTRGLGRCGIAHRLPAQCRGRNFRWRRRRSFRHPSLQSHILLLCLSVLVILTVVNLRGVRRIGSCVCYPGVLLCRVRRRRDRDWIGPSYRGWRSRHTRRPSPAAAPGDASTQRLAAFGRFHQRLHGCHRNRSRQQRRPAFSSPQGS